MRISIDTVLVEMPLTLERNAVLAIDRRLAELLEGFYPIGHWGIAICHAHEFALDMGVDTILLSVTFSVKRERALPIGRWMAEVCVKFLAVRNRGLAVGNNGQGPILIRVNTALVEIAFSAKKNLSIVTDQGAVRFVKFPIPPGIGD